MYSCICKGLWVNFILLFNFSVQFHHSVTIIANFQDQYLVHLGLPAVWWNCLYLYKQIFFALLFQFGFQTTFSRWRNFFITVFAKNYRHKGKKPQCKFFIYWYIFIHSFVQRQRDECVSVRWIMLTDCKVPCQRMMKGFTEVTKFCLVLRIRS